MEQMLSYLERKGKHEAVGAFYRNIAIAMDEEDHERSKKEYGERSGKTEGQFAVTKHSTLLDARLAKRGFAALIRVQHNGVPGMNGGRKVKVLYGVAAATVSRTARVSVARLNLKEAAGKVPARRTETVYEAVSRPDKLAIQSKVQQLHRSACVYTAGIWDEGIRSYPGRSGIMQQHVKRTGVSSVQTCCRKQFSDELLRCQKSAEGIVHAKAWKAGRPIME